MKNSKVIREAQFMPFDAIKGLQEELRKREEKHLRVEKKELSNEEQEEISNVIIKLNKGDNVKVEFYYFGHYKTICGEIKKIDFNYKYVMIENEKIVFDDIYKIDFIF